MPVDPPSTAGSAVAFEGVSMTFPGVRALDQVSFAVRPGSIHALLGENGAGKSTLLRIIAGAQQPTSGALLLEGRVRRFRDTADSLAAGVAVIHQELQLVPGLSVAENLYLGHLPRRCGFLDRSRLLADSRRHLAAIGEELDPEAPVGRLPLAQRQMVEIAKALTRGARVIAFDEPTSSLSAREVRRLFGIIRDLQARGCAVLYVSHRMDEVYALCDHLTVLRDGRHITTAPLSTMTREAAVQLMVGRAVATPAASIARRHLGAGLEVDELQGPGLAAPVSFAAGAGEILGLFGLVGAGRTELLRLIAGAARPRGGRVRVQGRTLQARTPREAIAAGVALCPEDRRKEGIVPIRSVLENLNLSARRRHAWAGGWINDRWEHANARARIAQLRVRTPSAHQRIRFLSGGNQQKVILGRWLSESIRVLLLDEPTRGIDVGAKEEIHVQIRDLAASGVCVILVSSELPEVLQLADRIAVMREGRLAAVVDRAQASEESLLRLALPSAPA
jgi:L-arabinose transport system ATP-binding protein